MLPNDLIQTIIRNMKDGNFATRVALGLVKGWEVEHKFGAGTITTSMRTVYDNMQIADYPYKFTNSIMTVESSQVGDTGQFIEVYYTELVGDKWVDKKGFAVTNGTTPVQVNEVNDDWTDTGLAANIMIPFRLINRGTGHLTGSLVGLLDLKTGATVYGQIVNGNNQSEMAIRPIPSGKVGIVVGVGRSVIGSAKGVTVNYNRIPFGQTRQVKRIVGLSESSDTEPFVIPYTFIGKDILEVQSKIDIGTASMQAWWDMYIVDSDKI